MTPLEEFCENLLKRAVIRRKIRKEEDRIAAQLERAVDIIQELAADRDHWHQAYKDLVSEKQQMELQHGRQQVG